MQRELEPFDFDDNAVAMAEMPLERQPVSSAPRPDVAARGAFDSSSEDSDDDDDDDDDAASVSSGERLRKQKTAPSHGILSASEV